MQIKNYNEIRDQLRPYLTDYLSLQGITNHNNFKCINPLHVDSNPSCGVLPDKTHFHCLSCSITGDIFDACHLIENKPVSGQAFITDNLTYLSGIFNISMEVGEISEQELLHID